MSDLETFFEGHAQSREIFNALSLLLEEIAPGEMCVSKSQVAFRRREIFLRAWIPGKYLHGRTAPLVLTFSFRSRDGSPRWKEIVEPAAGHFTHHLELYSCADLNDEVRGWLRQAWLEAG